VDCYAGPCQAPATNTPPPPPAAAVPRVPLTTTSLTVSSSGPAGRALAHLMGTYTKVEGEQHEGAPVWRQEGGEHTLFLTRLGYWWIDTGFREGGVHHGISAVEANTGDIPGQGWEYYEEGWKADPAIIVQ